MTDYQLVATDLDGTLTTTQKQITPHTQQVLLRSQQMGARLALVSGRPINGIASLAKQLQMDRFWGCIISFNGAKISSCSTGETLYERSLPQNVLPQLCGLNKKYRLTSMIYSPDTIITETGNNRYVLFDGRINHMAIEEVPDLMQRIDFPVHKFLFAGDPPYLEKLEPDIRSQFPSCSIYRSDPYYLEVMPSNVDKAQALSALLGWLHLTRQSLLACGDGFNDVSMVRFAGMGVAMENAQPEVKAAAKFVTRSNDEDGVAYAVQKFILHEV